MSDSDWAAIQADYRSYVANWHPARFTWVTDAGDRLEADAQVRLRGNPGFSWLGDKMQFLVSFDEVDPAGRFLGQRALVLDASWYNPTILRDRLAYAYLRRLGVPAPCANNARLTVNGSYYGLYTLIERLDQEFLDRVFGREAATGTLWEGSSDIDENAARRAARAYEIALHIMEQADPDWSPPVHTISGFSGAGLPELWQAIELHRRKTETSGSRLSRRAGQQVRWLDALIQDGLADRFASRPDVAPRLAGLRRDVAEGRIPASLAADELLGLAFGLGSPAG